jgi:hypothetical protein
LKVGESVIDIARIESTPIAIANVNFSFPFTNNFTEDSSVWAL